MERARKNHGAEADDDTQQYDDLVPAENSPMAPQLAENEKTLREQKESD